MSMPRTYITHDDMTVTDGDRKIRTQSPRLEVLDHSESDLRIHYFAGVAACIIIATMVVALMYLVVS